MPSYLHVAVGVVVNDQAQVLIARRPTHAHLGGLWEFPGGKLEAGESVEQALARELAEEIGIRVHSCRPLIKLHHNYPERRVLLDVWRVDEFSGTPHGRESQPVAWVKPDELSRYDFPEGNRPIIAAVRLPDRYALLDLPADTSANQALRRLDHLASKGVTLVQLRAKALQETEYRRLAQTVARGAESLTIKLLLNARPGLALECGAAGAHLSSSRLMALNASPLPAPLWVAASCHNAQELARAESIGADFAVLSPVKATASHADAEPLGWERFARYVEMTRIPLYALGGLTQEDLATAQRHGAQGIAAIRAFLPDG